jgi:hypothetical protein
MERQSFQINEFSILVAETAYWDQAKIIFIYDSCFLFHFLIILKVGGTRIHVLLISISDYIYYSTVLHSGS